LSHLNTYLNDKDWILRCSFFEALVFRGPSGSGGIRWQRQLAKVHSTANDTVSH
jgi:hypothetical protein